MFANLTKLAVAAVIAAGAFAAAPANAGPNKDDWEASNSHRQYQGDYYPHYSHQRGLHRHRLHRPHRGYDSSYDRGYYGHRRGHRRARRQMNRVLRGFLHGFGH